MLVNNKLSDSYKSTYYASHYIELLVRDNVTFGTLVAIVAIAAAVVVYNNRVTIQLIKQ